MPKRRQIGVVPSGQDWVVTNGGRKVETVDTKAEAVSKARELAKDGEASQLKIRGRDGRIQEERTYGGKDPYPPKG